MARPPDAGESRDNYLRVRLAPFEAAWLDAARDTVSRSEYVRELITLDAQQKGLT